MCDTSLLYSTKEVLRFLLTSNKRSAYTTIYTLADEFFNYAGYRIPYYKLGYRFLETFFYSIPDVLSVEPFTYRVHPFNCQNQTQRANVAVPAYCQTPFPSYGFRPQARRQGLQWNPGMSDYHNRTQWKQQRNHYNHSTKVNDFPPGQPSNRSKQIRPSTATISSPTIPNKSAKQVQKSITLLSNWTYHTDQASPRKDGDVESATVDVVTHETSVTKSRKVVTFSNYENLTATTIHSTELEESNASNMDSGHHIDNWSRVDTKMNVTKDENMPCLDLKETPVNDFPALGEKGLSDGNAANSDNTAPFLNSPKSSESGPPPYLETDTSNVAGAAAYYNDDLDSRLQKHIDRDADDELKKKSVESFNTSFYSSDSSDDEMPHKPNPNNQVLDKNRALPFIPDDDPIYMIGSKFWNERYGDKIETVNLESKMEVGRFYELYISEVNSPYKFWFQLTESDDSCELEELEKQINTFYSTSSISTDDLIDEVYMRKGYPCAALYGQQWHRAEFVARPEDHKVKVFFVDYGTVAKVATRDIRYLLNYFCKLPRSSCRGTLDFIIPKYQRWENEATFYFRDLIRDVKLVAGVSEINTKHNSARIYVIDQSKNTTINCKLVENGYAFPEDPRDRCQNHKADILPTFESLEKGDYPSLNEMDEYLAQGFDPEFKTTVIDGVDCYIPPYMSDEQAMETIQTFYREKEKAKEIASKRDATTFMHFFERILKNPFLNGKAFQVAEM